jgi:hypothetical protein
MRNHGEGTSNRKEALRTLLLISILSLLTLNIKPILAQPQPIPDQWVQAFTKVQIGGGTPKIGSDEALNHASNSSSLYWVSPMGGEWADVYALSDLSAGRVAGPLGWGVWGPLFQRYRNIGFSMKRMYIPPYSLPDLKAFAMGRYFANGSLGGCIGIDIPLPFKYVWGGGNLWFKVEIKVEDQTGILYDVGFEGWSTGYRIIQNVGIWPTPWTVTTHSWGFYAYRPPPFTISFQPIAGFAFVEISISATISSTLSSQNTYDAETSSDSPIEEKFEVYVWEQPAVGGIYVLVDKFGLLAPYIGLASTILVATAATAIYVKRVKHRKDKQ